MEELDLETRHSRNTLEQSHWHGDASASATCKGGNGTAKKHHSQKCFVGNSTARVGMALQRNIPRSALLGICVSDVQDKCAGVFSVALLPPWCGFPRMALLGWPSAEPGRGKGLFLPDPALAEAGSLLSHSWQECLSYNPAYHCWLQARWW